MAKIKRKVKRGLEGRQAVYLLNVPDSDKKGRTKPGSQNRKKSYAGATKGNRG